MENLIYALHPGTELREQEDHLALFSSWGNYIYIRSPLVTDSLADLCQTLIQPTSMTDIQKRMPHLSKEVLQQTLGLLQKHNLIHSYTQKEASALSISFLGQFYSQDAALQMETRIQNCEVLILHLLPETLDLTSFASLKFKSAEVFRSLEDIKKRIASHSENQQIIIYGSWNKTSQIEHWNAFALEHKIPWLLLMQDEFGGQVGPYFSGTDSPCFSCLKKRKASFFDRGSLLQKTFFQEPHLSTQQNWPLASQILIQLAATEIYKIAAHLPAPKIRRGAHLVDALNIKTKYAELLPVPYCESCTDFTQSPLGIVKSLETP